MPPVKQPVVTLNIKPGQVTPAQKQAWRRFWQTLISKAKNDER